MLPYEVIMDIVIDNYRFREIAKWFNQEKLWLIYYGDLEVTAKEIKKYDIKQYSIFIDSG